MTHCFVGFGATGNIGASIITNTILGVPYYNYNTIYPQTLRPLYSGLGVKGVGPLWLIRVLEVHTLLWLGSVI